MQVVSNQYRRAFELEAEEDEYDVMATGSCDDTVLGAMPHRPSRATEVLDDNPLDRLCALRRGLDVDESAKDAFPPAAAIAAAQGGEAGPTGAAEPKRQVAADAVQQEGSKARRVRFAGAAMDVDTAPDTAPEGASRARMRSGAQPWQPPHRRSGYQPPAGPTADSGSDHIGGNSNNDGRAGAWGGGVQPARPRGGRGGRQRGRGRFVPDHVRNPQKYTCYALEEVLVVGGGDKGNREDASMDEMHAAAKDASVAVRSAQGHAKEADDAHDPERTLPEFGKRIEFRPRSRLRQGDGGARNGREQTGAASKRAGSTHISAFTEEDFDSAPDTLMADHSPAGSLHPAGQLRELGTDSMQIDDDGSAVPAVVKIQPKGGRSRSFRTKSGAETDQ